MKKLFLFIAGAFAMTALHGQDMRNDTYCNPLNIDYTYMIYNSARDISYRSGADPAVVEFRGEYYMFVTRSHGYWHSTDLQNWEYVEPGKNWYPQGCNAPAAHNYKDSVLYVCGDPSGAMSVLYTDDPKSGDWHAVPAILHDLQDPDLFLDDDGKAYMFWGSSNVYPIRGIRLNKDHRFIAEGEQVELFNLDPEKHGWERFGENHTDTVLGGYIEAVADKARWQIDASGITDENSKTFWLASANDADQWLEIDLEQPATVNALQVNYNDYKSDMYGRYPDLRHRYTIEGSLDGKTWTRLVDRSKSYKDTPHDYVELETPARVRYIRYNNIEVPMPNLSISAIRVFGLGEGKAPQAVKTFEARRHDDRRDITLSWKPVKGAQGYNIMWGVAPDKLYSSWMVYGDAGEHLMKCLSTDQKYYFAIEAFNENGVAPLSKIIEVE